MATIKSCTDLEQSKKLAEILPVESADFQNKTIESNGDMDIDDVSYVINPCWSLAALLDFIPNYKLSSEHNKHTCTAETSFGKETVAWFDNPIDACVEMILKLNKLNLL